MSTAPTTTTTIFSLPVELRLDIFEPVVGAAIEAHAAAADFAVATCLRHKQSPAVRRHSITNDELPAAPRLCWTDFASEACLQHKYSPAMCLSGITNDELSSAAGQ